MKLTHKHTHTLCVDECQVIYMDVNFNILILINMKKNRRRNTHRWMKIWFKYVSFLMQITMILDHYKLQWHEEWNEWIEKKWDHAPWNFWKFSSIFFLVWKFLDLLFLLDYFLFFLSAKLFRTKSHAKWSSSSSLLANGEMKFMIWWITPSRKHFVIIDDKEKRFWIFWIYLYHHHHHHYHSFNLLMMKSDLFCIQSILNLLLIQHNTV